MNDCYPLIVINCNCGKSYDTTWHTGLAVHEMRYDRSEPQVFSPTELERKCCPGLMAPGGAENYGVEVPYALSVSDITDPLVLTLFVCPNCGASHIVLLDGRHRLYRALTEKHSVLYGITLNGWYMVSCEEKGVVA